MFFSNLEGDILNCNRLTPAFRNRIFAIGAKLNSEKNLVNLLDEVQIQICEMLQAEAASVFIYNEEETCLEFLSVTGEVRESIIPIKVPMHSIAGEAFLKGEGMIVNHLEDSSIHFKKTDQTSGFVTRNILVFPLKTEKTIGVIEILNRINGDFSQVDLDIFEIFSKMISFKIANEYNRLRITQEMKGIIESVSNAIDLRDRYTHQHSRNVAELSVRIGSEMSLSDEQLHELDIAALLHDIGKIGVKDRVLLKPSKLTLEEFALIQQHPSIGKTMLEEISVISEAMLRGIAEHHEKLDGSGYPNGLKGDEIHLFGRIIAVADIFDALINKRVYKKAIELQEVLSILDSMCPHQLDANIVGYIKKIVTH